MGRKKKLVQPWSSSKAARLECQARLGDELCNAALSVFQHFLEREKRQLTARPGRGEQVTGAIADLLYCLERGPYKLAPESRGPYHPYPESTISGGTGALLAVASGQSAPRGEDAFESLRKRWDQAMKRARQRRRWDGPYVGGTPVEELLAAHESFEEWLRPPDPAHFAAIERWHAALDRRWLHTAVDQMNPRELRKFKKRLASRPRQRRS
jgi:hypothetical protein